MLTTTQRAISAATIPTWALAAMLLTAVGCSSAADTEFVQYTEEDWNFKGTPGKVFRTENFNLFTTVEDPVFTEAIPDFLEASYRQYVDLMPHGNKTGKAMDTYLFASRHQWNRFTQEFAHPHRVPIYLRIQSGGFTERSTAVLHHIGRDRTLSVLAHEGFHQYVSQRFSEPIPAWLNEGMACYCEAYDLHRDRPIFTPTKNTFRMNNLRNGILSDDLIPIREMLQTHAGNIIELGGQRVGTYYAMAWALVVYLRHGEDGKHADGFAKLLADAGTPRLRASAKDFRKTHQDLDDPASFGESVFRDYVTDDLDAFEQDFHAFLNKLAKFTPGRAI